MNTFATLTEGQKQSVIEYAKTQGVDITTQNEVVQNTFTTMWLSAQMENAINSDNVGTQTQTAPNNTGTIESKPPSNVVGIPTIESLYDKLDKAKGRTLRKEGYSTRPLADVKYYLKKEEILPGGKDFEPYPAGVCVGVIDGVEDTVKIGLRKLGLIFNSKHTVKDRTDFSFIISQAGIDEIWKF